MSLEVEIYSPFLLVSPRLIILPTPSAIHVRSYRDLYAYLHSLPKFCEMGFGEDWPARMWDQKARYEQIEEEVERNWHSIGLGDMAVGLIPETSQINNSIQQVGRKIPSLDKEDTMELRIIEGKDYDQLVFNVKFLEEVNWVGYGGVRDARHGLPNPPEGEPPLSDWRNLAEVRYGINPDQWGKGYAAEASKSAMRWAVSERSVERFVAETQKENSRSGRVLEKLGFVDSGTNYWQAPRWKEWERVVG